MINGLACGDRLRFNQIVTLTRRQDFISPTSYILFPIVAADRPAILGAPENDSGESVLECDFA